MQLVSVNRLVSPLGTQAASKRASAILSLELGSAILPSRATLLVPTASQACKPDHNNNTRQRTIVKTYLRRISIKLTLVADQNGNKFERM